MSEKRKDTKGRLLRTGESQRKDGKYEFKYTDAKGERHSAYSWKLVETDRVPPGKRCTESLREMEKRLLRDAEDGIDSYGASRTTLNEYFDDYIAAKRELKQSTRMNYQYVYDKHVRNDLGRLPIAKIKFSDIRKFYLSLLHDKGFKPATLENVHAILHPVFILAVKDALIRINPSDGVIAELKKSHDWTTEKRHALTESQQAAFVDYVAASEKYRFWLPLFTVLLGTGGRIGEITGLRWCDCDFVKKQISINHNLTYRMQLNRKCTFIISTPKTKAGERMIPMLEDVRQALLTLQQWQNQVDFIKPEVDGYTDFVFLNRSHSIVTGREVNRVIDRICRDYNAKEVAEAEAEEREALLLPHFSVHNLRHTFCTRFCENETNLKIIQEIMGHADITTTMDVYNEATMEKKVESFANLEGKIKVS